MSERELACQLAVFFGGSSAAQLDWLSDGRVQLLPHLPAKHGPAAQLVDATEVAPRFRVSNAAMDIVFSLGSMATLAEDILPRWLAEIHRVTGRVFWLAVERQADRNRQWWEARFIEAGFRKHPLAQAVIPFEALEDHDPTLTLVFEKVPLPILARYPLTMLQAERNLHMDMLREPGIRSDAHLARYELARQHLAPDQTGKVVLDAACGLGYGCAVLAEAPGVARVIGVDCSGWAVDYARACYATMAPQLEFHAGDATRLDFLADASVDAVVSFETLEHLPNPDLLLREFARVLKPGGRFIGSVPNLWIDEQGRNPVPYHFHIYDHAQLRDQIARHFEWRALFRQNAGGGWKRPQPRILREIENQRPAAADEQDAEWWIAVADKAGAAAPSPARKLAAPEAAPRTPPPARKLCLATNYLLMTPGTRQMWESLAEQLGRLDCQLVLLTTNEPETPLTFPSFSHPYLMRDFAAAFPALASKGGLGATRLELAWLRADMSRAPIGYTLSESLEGLAAFQAYTSELLRLLQPGFLLIADNTLCQTALLHRACIDAGLPVQIYERGLLPETLMLESRGIQAWSDLRTHWLAQDLPGSACDAAAYEQIRSYYLSRKPQKYAQADFGGGGSEVRRNLGLEGKKVVVFLGGGYEANGHAPNGDTYERQFFTGFPTTQAALMGLWRIIEKMPNTALVFKPHPLDTDHYAVAKVEGVVVVRDLNVHSLIDAADVVAAQYTTLQFEAALYDKPILLLARSAWWGRNAGYEVESPEDLPAKLKAALDRLDWGTRRANAQAFCTWMMDQFLIGCADAVPARRKLSDLAKFVARLAVDGRGLPDPIERYEQAKRWIEGQRGATGRSTSHSGPGARTITCAA